MKPWTRFWIAATIVVIFQKWTSDPGDLEAELTKLKVRIERIHESGIDRSSMSPESKRAFEEIRARLKMTAPPAEIVYILPLSSER